MKTLALSLVLTSLVVAFTARAKEGDNPTAPATLGELTQAAVEKVKKNCGMDLAVRADPASYNETAWKAGGDRYMEIPDAVCSHVVQGIAEMCVTYGDPSPWKSVVAKEVK